MIFYFKNNHTPSKMIYGSNSGDVKAVHGWVDCVPFACEIISAELLVMDCCRNYNINWSDTHMEDNGQATVASRSELTGVLYYQLDTERYTATKKMVVIKRK